MDVLASVRQPSTFRMLIWPEASNAQNSIAAVSADGSTVCVLIRQLPRCGRQKKERSGLQSECDELTDKGAIHHRRIVLLCHKFRCLFRAAQHGQRESVVARAATNLRRIVAIEFGTWRSGRNGGSSGLVTFAYGNLRAQRGGTIS